jgi:hypothetical protein
MGEHQTLILAIDYLQHVPFSSFNDLAEVCYFNRVKTLFMSRPYELALNILSDAFST